MGEILQAINYSVKGVLHFEYSKRDQSYMIIPFVVFTVIYGTSHQYNRE